MRIAIFYSGYLPGENYGGPVRSISNFVDLLGADNEIYIICSNHDLKSSIPYPNIKKGWNHVGKARVLYLPDKLMKYSCFKEIIKKINPSVFYVSSIFSANITMPILFLSRIKNIPILLAPRGELNETALNNKSFKKKIYIAFLKLFGLLKKCYFQATSEEEMKNIIDYLGVKKGRVGLLPNIPVLTCHKNKIIKDRNSISICFVGRILPNKNLLYAIDAIMNSAANVTFDIYGNIEDEDYWNQCKARIEKCPSNILIRYMGNKSASEIEKIYFSYHLLISPTLFENYGQAIAEAMLHDTPVLISKGTTPWDAINEYHAGYSVSLNDQNVFTEVIDSVASFGLKEYIELIEKLRNYCSVTFDYEDLFKKYTHALNAVNKQEESL